MDLIDRYLVAVRRQLPAGLQTDIVQELGDSLRSEAEEQERQAGRPLTADEQAALLRKRGHPWLMANRYLPQQHLIGPALFPYYRQALKIVVFWVVLPIALIGGAVHAIYSPDMSRAWGQALGGAWNGAIYAVGIVTIVFALIDRQHVRINVLDNWNPATLPEPSDGRAIPRSESVVGLVITLTLAIWWMGLTPLPAFTVYSSDDVRFVGAPIWEELHPGIAFSLLAAAALHLIDLVRPWRTAVVSAFDIAISLFNLLLITLLVRAGHYVDVLGGNVDADKLTRSSEWFNRIAGWSLMIVGAGIAVHMLWEVWLLVKSRRIGSLAAGARGL